MRRFLSAIALLCMGIAFGHADLLESEPAAGAVLDSAPQQVVLHYTEPVEALFSVFKVYRLDAEVDLDADNAQQRLNGLAAALVNDVLELQDDEEARVDVGAI